MGTVAHGGSPALPEVLLALLWFEMADAVAREWKDSHAPIQLFPLDPVLVGNGQQVMDRDLEGHGKS